MVATSINLDGEDLQELKDIGESEGMKLSPYLRKVIKSHLSHLRGIPAIEKPVQPAPIKELTEEEKEERRKESKEKESSPSIDVLVEQAFREYQEKQKTEEKLYGMEKKFSGVDEKLKCIGDSCNGFENKFKQYDSKIKQLEDNNNDLTITLSKLCTELGYDIVKRK